MKVENLYSVFFALVFTIFRGRMKQIIRITLIRNLFFSCSTCRTLLVLSFFLRWQIKNFVARSSSFGWVVDLFVVSLTLQEASTNEMWWDFDLRIWMFKAQCRPRLVVLWGWCCEFCVFVCGWCDKKMSWRCHCAFCLFLMDNFDFRQNRRNV